MDLKRLYDIAANDVGWSAEYLESVAEDFELVSTQLKKAAEVMKSKGLSVVHLKAESAFGEYRRGIIAVGDKAEGQVREQIKCAKEKTLPSWLLHKLKRSAADNGTTVTAILEAAGVLTTGLPPAVAFASQGDFPKGIENIQPDSVPAKKPSAKKVTRKKGAK